MKVDFGKIINFSVRRTRTILLSPFNLRKWLVLASLALLSGQLSMSSPMKLLNVLQGQGKTCPLSSQASYIHFVAEEEFAPQEQVLGEQMPQDEQAPEIEEPAAGEPQDFTKKFSSPGQIIGLVVFISVIAIALFILLGWITSVFFFVFLQNIVDNTAEVKRLFKENRGLGTSYFGWNMGVGICFLAMIGFIIWGCFRVLDKAGLLGKAEPDVAVILSAISGYIIPGILLVIGGVLIYWVTLNFVLPIMFKEKISILGAWNKALTLVQENAKDVFMYLLLSLALSIAIGIISVIIGLIIMLVFVIVGVVCFLIYKFLFAAIAKGIMVFVLALIGISLFAVLYGLASLAFLPFSVFWRLFNLKFLGDLDSRYALLSEE